MRRQHYEIGQRNDDFAIILNEIDSETGKSNHRSVILVGFKSEEAAQRYIDGMSRIVTPINPAQLKF